MSYWDTSALLKLYLEESDSVVFEDLMRRATPRMMAFIGKHEARTAFRRRESDKDISPGCSNLCYTRLLQDISTDKITLIPESVALENAFGEVLERCLSQSPSVLVRTNDALHLVAAMVAGETDFVSADTKQRTAATHLGFNVLPAVYPVLPSTP
jgi:predicted nucleic acid-binding protein